MTPHDGGPERLHRISHIAEILDASLSTVRRLIADGLLDPRYIRGSLRVTDTSLQTLLQAGTRRSRRRSKN
jgi:hypothetical protein